MSTWSDTIALVKAGYKASEIKELLKLKDEQEEEKPDDINEDKTEPETKPEPEKTPDPEPAPVEEPENEYKNKYEALLKEMQRKKTKEDISGDDNQKTIEEQANEILADIIGG